MKTKTVFTDKFLDDWCEKNGAMVVWQTWRDTMIEQGREVKNEYMSWDTLPERDKKLDATIAKEVLQDYVNYLQSHNHETLEHIDE